MSLALASVLAVSGSMRPAVAALGALFAVAVSYSFLTLGWHFPSDVFGGFLVAATWTLLAIAGLLATEARSYGGRRRTISPVSIARTLGPARRGARRGRVLWR